MDKARYRRHAYSRMEGYVRGISVALLYAVSGMTGASVIYHTNLDTDPGWTTQGQWAFGMPTGSGGGQWGNHDPTAGATGNNVYGVNLNGDYSLTVGGPYYLTAGPFDCSHYWNVSLRFQRWLNTDCQPFVYATVQVSNNGTSWASVFSNGSFEIADGAWTLYEYDLSAVANDQATVYVRWGYEIWDENAYPYSGWNIDDVALTGAPIPPFVETYRFERLWPQLPQPWYFFGPTGVAVDASGNVYVADRACHRIQKLDSSGRFLTKWGSYGTGDGQFDYPEGVALDASGNVYVADTNNHRIQKFDSSGRFLAKWGSRGSGDGQFYYPQGVAVDASGKNVYIADTSNHRIQEFDLSGTFLGKWGSEGAGHGQFDNPEGVAVDASGKVYVADTQNHRIQKLDTNGAFLTEWGGQGTGDGQFDNPKGVAVDASGNVYVADTNNHRIQTFDTSGAFIAKWGSGEGPGDGQFRYPQGVALDASGRVYVVEIGNNGIQKLDSTGTFLAKWRSSGAGNGYFSAPRGVAMDASGNVYVADMDNNRIQKFDTNGAFIAKWGSGGTVDGHFQYPSGVAVDTAGYVYVADTFNHRIQKFEWNSDTQQYDFLTKWGGQGTADGQFSYPFGVAVDASGNVYVADSNNNRIQKFDSGGTFITKWGVEGTGDGQFFSPYGVTVDALGKVYVAESGNNRIQKFDSTGTFLAKWGSYGTGDGQFKGAGGIAVDTARNVYVIDGGNNRIQKFGSTGAFLGKWGGFGAGPGQLNNPFGLAVDGSGNVYVTDSGNSRIQKFRPVTLFSYDKAVLVAGRKSADDILWPATQKVTLDAIKALNFRGISKEQIRYLSHNTELDVDGNFLADDVAGLPTAPSLQNALTSWATDSLNGLPIENVVVYLADHGGPDHYYLSEDVTLDAATLDGWLDTLEAGIEGHVTVVLEACYSGSFLSTLKKPGRTVITSTLPSEEAYFLDNGVASFSGFFWQQVLFGRDLKTGFTAAQAAVNTGGLPQHPQVDVDGDGTANEAVHDLNALADVHIGSNIEYVTAFPTISSVAITGLSESTATLQANGVTDADGSVARVFAKIQPPGFGTTDFEGNPILGLPEVTLDPIGGDNYQIAYNGFTKQGTYHLTFYAMDNFLYLGETKSTSVTVGAPHHRRAVLVAGGSLSHQQWPAYARSYGRAFEALRKQLYDDSDIMVFAHSNVVSTTEPVTVPTLAGLTGTGAGTLRDWVGTNTQDLMIYLVGPGADDLFQLNDDEYLTGSAFGTLLNTLHSSISGTLVTVIDACSAGSFADNIAGADRMLVTSAREGESARFVEEDTGVVSFSEYFWTRTGKGDTLELAYLRARDSMGAYDQTPGLDDNGDGLLSQVSDGSKARYYRIGHGIILGADEPVVRDAIDYAELSGGASSATLWADGVFSPGRTVTSVWASIAPPGYGSGDACQALLTRIPLHPGMSHDYEALYNKFTKQGDYQIKIFCMDNKGNTSQARSAAVKQTAANLADTVEPDVTEFSPANLATGVSPYPAIRFTATDTGSGVDINAITLLVNGVDVSDELFILGTPGSYAVRYSPREAFMLASTVYVVVTVGDLDGNVKGPLTSRFTVTNGVDGGDADTLPDDWATYYGITNPAADPDGDGYTNAQEAELGTDPLVADSAPAGPDVYENDDTPATASWVKINGTKQSHNFHDLADIDWVEFYAKENMRLTLRTLNLGVKADTRLEVYAEGNYTTPVATDSNPGELAAVITDWAAPSAGYYFVKIRNADTCQNRYGAEASYSFEVIWLGGGVNLEANAGYTLRCARAGQGIVLDGRESTDNNHLPKTFVWTMKQYPGYPDEAALGIRYELEDVDPLPPVNLQPVGMIFGFPLEGLYVVSLVVGDDGGHTDETRVAIRVGPSNATVWVDFDATGFIASQANGSTDRPFKSVLCGAAAVDPSGAVKIKAGTTSETLTLSGKAFRMQADGGLVRIGVAGTKSALNTEDSASLSSRTADENALCYDDIGATVALGGAGAARTRGAQDDAVHYDRSTYEPVLPFTRTADGFQAAQADSTLAIRLRSEADIDPSSIWGPVPGYDANNVRVTWRPTVGAAFLPHSPEALRDIWVIFQPQETWYLEDIIPLTTGATTATGESIESIKSIKSMTYQFRIESETQQECRLSEPVPAIPQPAYGQDFDASELDEGLESNSEAEVTPADEDAVTMPLPEGVDTPVIIGPEQVYDTPQRVWLPVPEGVNPGDVRLYYYHATGDAPGWYPAENVEGWLVPDSYLHLRLDGTTYLGFLVRHAGIVQLGIPERQER